MDYSKPLIGITINLEETSKAFAERPWYAIRKDYTDAIATAGGIAVLLPYDYESIDYYVNTLDGLVISGGDFDINPKYYSQEITSETVHVQDARTDFEYKLTEKFLSTKKPILGICGGEQLLNVILGGSLIQHIPDSFPDSQINHTQPSPKNLPTHNVKVTPGTEFAKIIGLHKEGLSDDNANKWDQSHDNIFKVNSTHHQAVAELGKGIRVSAVAEDGIIEAIEYINHPFCIGVQWHPEYLSTIQDKKLLAAFINAARASQRVNS